MSILFPKVNKAPEWNYRPMYFDPEKEKREERRVQIKREEKIRKLHEENASRYVTREKRKSNLIFLLALLVLFGGVFWYLYSKF